MSIDFILYSGVQSSVSRVSRQLEPRCPRCLKCHLKSKLPQPSTTTRVNSRTAPQVITCVIKSSPAWRQEHRSHGVYYPHLITYRCWDLRHFGAGTEREISHDTTQIMRPLMRCGAASSHRCSGIHVHKVIGQNDSVSAFVSVGCAE